MSTQEYEFRPGRIEDIPALVAVEAAYDLVFYDQTYADVWLDEDWKRPRFDPGRDAWVVTTEQGQPVAYGQTYDEDPNVLVEAFARVHPDHWGEGIGSRLVELTERRAREHIPPAPDGSISLVNVVTSVDDPAHELLESRGYDLDRHFWHMHLSLGGPLPATASPEGIELRTFDESIALPVHAVLETAFKDHYQFAPTPFEEWEKVFREPHFDPDLWLVAADGERVVGALAARVMGDEGWVRDLGVLEDYRGRGIGAALLARSFETFKARGFGSVALNVDSANETGATALYERVGMRVRRQWDLYLKILRAGSGPATPGAS